MNAPDTAAASLVTDHAYRPRAEWWTLCAMCGLGESAHRYTITHPELYPFRDPHHD